MLAQLKRRELQVLAMMSGVMMYGGLALAVGA